MDVNDRIIAAHRHELFVIRALEIGIYIEKWF